MPKLENSIISLIFCFNISSPIPYDLALRIIFSLPVNSGLNPAPNSMIALTFPSTSNSPRSGTSIPANSLKKVVFPAPFCPIIPTTSLLFISRLISSRAQTSSHLTLPSIINLIRYFSQSLLTLITLIFFSEFPVHSLNKKSILRPGL